MSVALGNCKSAVAVEISRKDVKISKTIVTSHVCPVESSKLSIGRNVPSCSTSLSAQHPVVAVSSSDTRDTIAVNSPSSAHREKMDAASNALPLGSGSKRRSVVEGTAVASGVHLNIKGNKSWFSSSLSRKNPSLSLFFFTAKSCSW